MQIQNKTIVITGAAQGLGLGIALGFAKKGAQLALLDLNEEALKQAQQQCIEAGAQAHYFICNVAKEEEVVATFARIKQALGAVHGLVNNAGIARDAVLVSADKNQPNKIAKKMQLSQWQSVIDVNLTGVFLCAREAAALMIESEVDEGVIVNISSVARAGNYGVANYSATKAGVVAMAETWAKELARYGIRTGCVAPGVINTELLAQTQEAARERLIASIALKRVGEAEHIASSVIFIFENDYMTGRVIECDGGMR